MARRPFAGKKRRPPIEVDAFEERGLKSRPNRAEILHDDPDFLVVSKPAGAFLVGGLYEEPSVIEQLAQETGTDESDLSAVYPLEPDVSGILLVSRNAETEAAFDRQFDDGRLTVTYLAVVRGMLMSDAGTIEERVSSPRGGRVKVVTDQGERGITEWRVRDSFVGFALLECTPRTRAEQQIRAHLAHVGIPLAVDAVHGGGEFLKLSSFKAGYRPSRRHPERPLISRPSMHAMSVTFEHPRTGAALTFDAPLPRDFRATLHQLDRFARVPR